jgi:hypothetical protein
VKSGGQVGQASIEVLVIASALVVALFFPFSHQEPVFVVLIHALANYFSAQSFVVSII